MNNLDYNKWLKKKIDKLAYMSTKCNGNYCEDTIREYLIFLCYTDRNQELIEFFKQNSQDEELLRLLLKILLDESEDYSNDARYSAARMILFFPVNLLKKYKKELQYAQNYNIIRLRPFPEYEPDWLAESRQRSESL